MQEDTIKKIIDSEKIYHNGINNAVKGVIFELEPEIYELAKGITEDTTLVVELKLVDKKGNVVALDDPFKEVKTKKAKKNA